ncbi:MAG: hypothetical protein ACXWI5_07460 [Croceibacterium sp.]
MKDGDEPQDANARPHPQQQEDEEFGKIKKRQLAEDNFAGRSDTPRGSEPETRSASGNRT